MKMRCFRKILRISYKDHVTNEEVRATIQQAIGSHEDGISLFFKNCGLLTPSCDFATQNQRTPLLILIQTHADSGCHLGSTFDLRLINNEAVYSVIFRLHC